MLYRPAPRLLRRTVDHKFNGGGLRSETDKIFVLLQKAHELVSRRNIDGRPFKTGEKANRTARRGQIHLGYRP